MLPDYVCLPCSTSFALTLDSILRVKYQYRVTILTVGTFMLPTYIRKELIQAFANMRHEPQIRPFCLSERRNKTKKK